MDRSSSRTMLRTSLVVLLSLASLVLARPASAQSTGEYSLTSSSRFTLDLGFYYGEAPDLIGQRHGRALLVPSLAINADVLAISDDVSLSVDVQFRSVASLGRWLLEDRTDFRAGNLYGGVRVAVRPMRELRVRGGFGVVGPIMNVYDDGSLIPPVAADLAIFQVPLSALPNGAWDPWMVSRGYVPLVFRVDAEYRQDWLFFGGEAALGPEPCLARRHAEVQVEAAREVRGVLEADAVGDLRDRQRPRHTWQPGCLQSHLLQQIAAEGPQQRRE
jgi:hypothetical protein